MRTSPRPRLEPKALNSRASDLWLVDAAGAPFAGVGVSVAPIGDLISAVLVVVPKVRGALALVGPPVALVGLGLALVGQPVTFVGVAVTLVGHALAFVWVLLAGRTLDQSPLGGALALGSRLRPMAGLDGSGRIAGHSLGVSLAAVIGGDHSLLCRPSLVSGDLLFDRPRPLGLFSHVSATPRPRLCG
ncbi:MAG TPA: hypothetical protein VFR22_15855 [Nocardioidaceae bacterium]|nr:hypothetical protein [Nocardioidaceae bacterium]